ncbi:hypothetical protein [Natrinema soli]|uniref:Uncharacterized protein n=1 Tax=Natrinema soli TaxID=1930624 RepID=A0ABD5T2Y7_9EURY|nr:hypothetical protein [Natrinema soli]
MPSPRGRQRKSVFRDPYCLSSLDAAIDADQPVQAHHPPIGKFDDRLFQTDD